MVTIKSKNSIASFTLEGAELRSLKINGKEYIFPGDDRFWDRSSPILFPICSRLKDDEYIYEGKAYKMYCHGYARFEKFEVLEKSENSVTFIHSSNEQTRKSYPFDYDLKITYTLIDKKLEVVFDVFNKGKDAMYFSIGGHEGYLFEDGICDLDIIFPKKVTLDAWQTDGPVLNKKTVRVLENEDVIHLNYDLIRKEALIFKDIDFETLTISNRKTGQQIKVDFEGFKYLLIWSKPDAPYVSAETWCGITDSFDTDKNIKTKEGINSLPAGEHFIRTHSFEIVKEK